MKNAIKDIYVNKDLQNIALYRYDLTDSTNTRAKLYAKFCCEEHRAPAIFLSRAQSAGRGTRGRSFESPKDAGLYVSYLVYPDKSIKNPSQLTTYAAVACCRALRSLSKGKFDPRIKWVNDIYVGGRKLAGILTEGELTPDGSFRYAVVGIGINLSPSQHSPEVEAIMTTLSDEGVCVGFDELFVALTDEFFSGLCNAGAKTVLSEYRDLSMLIGKDVHIVTADGEHDETVTDIDSDGALITCDGKGNTKKYISGDVSVRL